MSRRNSLPGFPGLTVCGHARFSLRSADEGPNNQSFITYYVSCLIWLITGGNLQRYLWEQHFKYQKLDARRTGREGFRREMRAFRQKDRRAVRVSSVVIIAIGLSGYAIRDVRLSASRASVGRFFTAPRYRRARDEKRDGKPSRGININ